MRTLVKLGLLLSLALGVASAQNTTVTGTVTDSDSIAWANGSISFNLIGSNGPYYCGGTLMTQSQLTVVANLNSSGAFSTSICDNTKVTPVNTSWSIRVCSATTAPCQTIPATTVSGASQSLSTYINGLIAPIRIAAVYGTRAYADVEIISPIGGTTYYSLTASGIRLWNGAAWTTLSGGGVTSVTNSDGSLTCSNTSGAVICSINLAHSNVFTATQTAPTWKMSNNGTITDDGGGNIYFGPGSGGATKVNGNNFAVISTGMFQFYSGNLFASPDTAISRAAAGVLAVGNGTAGDHSGTVSANGYEAQGTPGVSKTCGATIVVVNGIVTSC